MFWGGQCFESVNGVADFVNHGGGLDPPCGLGRVRGEGLSYASPAIGYPEAWLCVGYERRSPYEEGVFHFVDVVEELEVDGVAQCAGVCGVAVFEAGKGVVDFAHEAGEVGDGGGEATYGGCADGGSWGEEFAGDGARVVGVVHSSSSSR